MKKISRIFIRLPNWIGDVCMSLASLNAVINTGAKVVICAKPWAENLLAAYTKNPDVEFLALSGKWRNDSKNIRTYRKSNPVAHKEVGLLIPDSLTSALTFKFAGLASAGYKDDGRSLILRWPVTKINPRPHNVNSWYHLTRIALGHWGFNCKEQAEQNVSLPFTEEHITEKDVYMSQHGLKSKEFIVIAPTAKGLHHGKSKVWPEYEKLTQALHHQGHRVIMCPPPNEAAQAKTNATSAEMLPPLALGPFTALLKEAALVICNDSGVSHLSAAATAKQITLIGVSEIEHTGPWSSNALVLGDVNCWPTLDEVLAAISSLETDRPNNPNTL